MANYGAYFFVRSVESQSAATAAREYQIDL
jgi:hypothetical protein